MGCCQSRDHDDDASAPPHPVTGDGTSTAPVLARSTSEIPSPRIPASPRQHAPSARSRRRSRSEREETPLTEHFNKPLVPHVWDGKHKYTRNLPGPNSRRKIWTRRSLEHEREVFFETQTTGAPEIWNTLRVATDMLRQGDIATAQSIVDAAELTVPYGDPAYGIFDSQGQFYQMPEWAIADPTEVIEHDPDDDENDQLPARESEKDSDDSESRREAKGKSVMRPADTFLVKARLSDRGGPEADIKVHMGHDESVRSLIKRIKEEARIESRQTVRIAYLGKLLKENISLKDQGWKDGYMVNALVTT